MVGGRQSKITRGKSSTKGVSVLPRFGGVAGSYLIPKAYSSDHLCSAQDLPFIVLCKIQKHDDIYDNLPFLTNVAKHIEELGATRHLIIGMNNTDSKMKISREIYASLPDRFMKTVTLAYGKADIENELLDHAAKLLAHPENERASPLDGVKELIRVTQILLTKTRGSYQLKKCLIHLR